MPAGVSSSPPDVWIVTLPAVVAPDRLARCLKLLDDDERTRVAAFRVEPARQEYVVAHALLRTSLSTRADVPPTAWRFGRGEYGKPFVTTPPGAQSLAFNLSHTTGVVAAAVSHHGPIGLDVQAVHRPIDIGLFRLCLADAEVAELNALPEDARRRRFYAIWTAKESVAKAVGTGISSAMAGIRFVTEGGMLRSRSPDPRYADWYLTQHELPGGERCVVSTRDPAVVRFRTLELDDWIQKLCT